jgi:hypothetical protein
MIKTKERRENIIKVADIGLFSIIKDRNDKIKKAEGIQNFIINI